MTEHSAMLPPASGSAFPAWVGDPALQELQRLQLLMDENALLREEIRISRESAEITASLVVKQFEETERVLNRLQVSNAQREAVLASATHISIVATDSTGTITVFNKGAENLLGYKANEMIGRQTPLVFHRAEEIQVHASALSAEAGRPIEGLAVFFELAITGRDRAQEWSYVRRDGMPFTVNLSINALRNAEGEVDGFLCIAADITQAKRAEQARKESERQFRLLINNIPNIVFKGYPDGSIDFYDNKIEDLTGFPKAAFLTRQLKWIDLIVEEDRPIARERFLEALRTDRQYIREYRIRKRNGDIVWLQASSQIVCDAQGQIEFISGAFLDITIRKQAEAALQVSEEKYRGLFDSGPNPIFVLDPVTSRILDVNPAALDAYGYAKSELRGRFFNDLGEFELPDLGLPREADVAAPGFCFVNQKVRHRKKDGTPFYLRVKACAIKYRDRQALILAATDITEAIEKDAQLFQANKMKTLGEMSAGMAHELTQPLNAIKIGNDFLLRCVRQNRAVATEDVTRVASAVVDQVQRAIEIINRLREFGRRPDFRQDPVDLNVILENVMAIIGQQLALINIEVIYDLDPDLPLILANQNRLEQVLFNLVVNARDAIGAAGGDRRTITLTTRADPDYVTCHVADTGTGIAHDHRDKIFEPFFTTKEVGEGMGLGLAISYGIVRDCGGTIHAGNLADGGARFTLRFPRASQADGRFDAASPETPEAIP